MKTMPNLEGFTGTLAYHKLTMFSNLKFTDGWAFLAEDLGCFWLADILASVQHKPKVRDNNSFIIWRIVVNDKSEAVVSGYTDCEEDGSYSVSKRVYTQKIPYTDFPIGEFEWYQQGDVVLLKQEH